MPAPRAKTRSIRARALELVRSLDEQSTWDDVMYQIYVRQKIEAGLEDLRAGKTHSHAAIRREFLRP